MGDTGFYNPLTAKDEEDVDQCLEAIRMLEGFFQRCTNCGIEVKDHLARLTELKSFFVGIKRHFFGKEV